MGKTEITLCGGVPFNHGEPLQTFLRIENRRRSFTAALREPEFLEISKELSAIRRFTSGSPRAVHTED